MMMNWNDLKTLHNKGHYIGSHTVTHSMLGTMTNEMEIRNELTKSAKLIEYNLGYYPLTISYPVGSFNSQIKKISDKSGYKIGLAVKQDIYSPNNDDIFEVSRIELYNEPWWKTKLRISNNLEKIKRIIKH